MVLKVKYFPEKKLEYFPEKNSKYFPEKNLEYFLGVLDTRFFQEFEKDKVGIL